MYKIKSLRLLEEYRNKTNKLEIRNILKAYNSSIIARLLAVFVLLVNILIILVIFIH